MILKINVLHQSHRHHLLYYFNLKVRRKKSKQPFKNSIIVTPPSDQKIKHSFASFKPENSAQKVKKSYQSSAFAKPASEQKIKKNHFYYFTLKLLHNK